jgi:hypothetical protein
VKSIGKRVLVVLGSSLFGSTLWLTSFAAVIVGTGNLPKDIGPVDEVFVMGGGFILAGTLGIACAVYVLRRFHSWAISK